MLLFFYLEPIFLLYLLHFLYHVIGTLGGWLDLGMYRYLTDSGGFIPLSSCTCMISLEVVHIVEVNLSIGFN
jgi:hypothetical protein